MALSRLFVAATAILNRQSGPDPVTPCALKCLNAEDLTCKSHDVGCLCKYYTGTDAVYDCFWSQCAYEDDGVLLSALQAPGHCSRTPPATTTAPDTGVTVIPIITSVEADSATPSSSVSHDAPTGEEGTASDFADTPSPTGPASSGSSGTSSSKTSGSSAQTSSLSLSSPATSTTRANGPPLAQSVQSTSSQPSSTSAAASSSTILSDMTTQATSDTRSDSTSSSGKASSTFPSAPPQTSTDSKTGLSTGDQAGIGVGVGIAVLVLAILAIMFYLHRRKKRQLAIAEYPPALADGDVSPFYDGKKELDGSGGATSPNHTQHSSAQYTEPGSNVQCPPAHYVVGRPELDLAFKQRVPQQLYAATPSPPLPSAFELDTCAVPVSSTGKTASKSQATRTYRVYEPDEAGPHGVAILPEAQGLDISMMGDRNEGSGSPVQHESADECAERGTNPWSG
jgi:hypothetical protein